MLKFCSGRSSSASLIMRLNSALGSGHIPSPANLPRSNTSSGFIIRRPSSSNHHEDHKNSHGQIKESLITERKQFLSHKGMLKNCKEFEGRHVYENKHLFSLTRKNRRRMLRGRAPFCPNGEPITLHHVDQTHKSDWVALRRKLHRDNDDKLHSQTTVEGSVQRNKFARERKRYWKSRLNNKD